jgi:hypothetical protein
MDSEIRGYFLGTFFFKTRDNPNRFTNFSNA